jgi:hypothetical protein
MNAGLTRGSFREVGAPVSIERITGESGDSPMTSTATPVSAAAEQEHYHNDNQDQFHGISPLMATAFFAAYLSVQRRLQNIVPNKRATRQLALRRVSNFAQSSARLRRARIRSMRSC